MHERAELSKKQPALLSNLQRIYVPIVNTPEAEHELQHTEKSRRRDHDYFSSLSISEQLRECLECFYTRCLNGYEHQGKRYGLFLPDNLRVVDCSEVFAMVAHTPHDGRERCFTDFGIVRRTVCHPRRKC